MTWATRSRDKLLEEVSAKEDSARSQLRAEKTAATVTMEILSALVSRAARVTGKDPDVLSLRNELRAAPLSDDRFDHHRQRADRQEPVWGWKYDVTEASVLQPEVVQAYMGAGGGGGPCSCHQAPVTERAGGQGGPLDERDDRNQQQRHCNHRQHRRNHHRHHCQHHQHRRQHHQHLLMPGWSDIIKEKWSRSTEQNGISCHRCGWSSKGNDVTNERHDNSEEDRGWPEEDDVVTRTKNG